MNARRLSGVAAVLLGAALTACSGGADDAADTVAAVADTGVAVGAAADGIVDPNAATREQLVDLPGMIPAAADSLVAKRPFENMTAVNQVLTAHLDSAQRRTVYAHLWKPLDLNAATDEEILLIPGIGPRMLREFKEYRPYTSIEQFRREMGKYVDDAEVARLETYVEVR